MTAKPQLNVGVIGVGRIGKLHAEHLAARIRDARLAAVADIQPAAVKSVAVKWPSVKAHSDYHAILEDSSIDAVLICSATNTHALIIEEAADAGKHIFCEKPIDCDLAKIDKALAAVVRAGVKLQVGFNRRFDANFRKAYSLVREGKVGEVHLLRITSRDPAPPPIDYLKAGGGMFLDMTIHDFDMARYLIQSEIEEVYAAGAVLVDPAIGEAGDIDTAIINLRFENGTLGCIDNSYQAVYGYDQRVEVFGSRGQVTVANNLPDTHTYSNAEGSHSSPPLEFLTDRYIESYIAELNAFVDCIQSDGQPPVTGADGRAAVVVALAAQKSLRENRPVKTAEIDA